MASFQGLHTRPDLAEQFGPVVAEGFPTVVASELLGEDYRDVLAETAAIAIHQWDASIRRSAVRGFFLSGPPGVGKTTLVRRVAYELMLRPSAESSAANGDAPVVLALIDGAEIARARYGESEERIRSVFAQAESGFQHDGQRAVILFDDVESILMARGSENAKEWHFSQDSVFFHAVDELDTSRAIVFLTSNRPDLVDAAILDRFLGYTFGPPDVELLVEVAERRASEQQLEPEQVVGLTERVRRGFDRGEVRSIRDAERMVVRQYVEGILGRKSRARVGAG